MAVIELTLRPWLLEKKRSAFAFMILLLVVTTLTAATLLRAAISLTNNAFNRLPSDSKQPKLDTTTNLSPDSENPANENPFAKPPGAESIETSSDSNPYAAPTKYGTPAIANTATTDVIPVPKYSKACMIVLFHGLTAGFINSMVKSTAASVSGGEPQIFLSLIVGFMVAIILYRWMLSTTVGKAAVIYIFQVLLLCVLIALVFAIIFALSFFGYELLGLELAN